MRIIGIDPGYDRFGIAVIERVNGKETVLHSSCVTTDKKAPFPDRLRIVGDGLALAIIAHSPKALALEQLFFNKNVKTALGVAEARGVALYVARTHNLPVFEYSPQAVKIATTGYGKSEKKQVEEMLHRLVLNVPKKALDDEYDAIAVALACLVSERWN
jgi:crossover junction endodeoxyribonuclease RuvC